MYYDRHIDDGLACTLMPGGSLSWLMDHVHSKEGRTWHAHLQFRRARGNRRFGSIQLYWGRTSPLEFRLSRDGRIRLQADRTYRDISEQLFSDPIPVDRLGILEGRLRDYLQQVQKLLESSPSRRKAFVKREAICHAGLIRRHGHCWRSDDPLVVVDSEVQIGFASRDLQRADNTEIRRRLSLSRSGSLPTKLDALGVLPTGDLALVEVKGAAGNIRRALVQVAVHTVRFSRLMADCCLRDTIQTMLDQKIAAGMLPYDCPHLGGAPRIVPCIAAPDTSPDWPVRWNEAIDECREELTVFPPNLLLLRLCSDGHIRDVRTR